MSEKSNVRLPSSYERSLPYDILIVGGPKCPPLSVCQEHHTAQTCSVGVCAFALRKSKLIRSV